MDLYEKFKTDDKYETRGIWIDIVGTPAKFLIARPGGANKKYKTRLRQLNQKHLRHILNNTADYDAVEANNLRAFIETCVLDWDGVQDPESGEFIEFSRGAAIKLFDDLPELANEIMQEASKYSNYREAEIEEAGESSPGTLTG